MPDPEDKKMMRASISISMEDWKKLNIFAEKYDSSLAWVVRQAIKKYIEIQERK